MGKSIFMKKELSAGAIIIKMEEKNILILLVEHKNSTYVFPKGHVKRGETLKQAAKREVLEEVGLNIKVGKRLGKIIRGSSDKRTTKEIIMFLGTPKNYCHSPNTEEKYKWFTFKKAIKVLRYEEDLEFLIKYKNEIFL